MADPKTMSSRPTGSRGLNSRCQRTDPLSAMTMTMPTTKSAVPTVMRPETTLAPVSTTDRIGRYGAITRSSMTRTLTTGLVSGLRRQR